jgi:hypothetical protein
VSKCSAQGHSYTVDLGNGPIELVEGHLLLARMATGNAFALLGGNELEYPEQISENIGRPAALQPAPTQAKPQDAGASPFQSSTHSFISSSSCSFLACAGFHAKVLPVSGPD